MSRIGTGLGRRQLLSRGGLAAGVLLSQPFEALIRNGKKAARADVPLYPTPDQHGVNLLKLPAGFSYISFGFRGDPMSDGSRTWPTPSRHDGGATFWDSGTSTIKYLRNHEIRGGAPFAKGVNPYDASTAIGGGVTAVSLGVSGTTLTVQGTAPRLTGTNGNCSGGPTPWGTWLTCEEDLTNSNRKKIFKNHGYVLEVPAFGPTPTSTNAIVEMGRFNHEGAAVDPTTGFVYLTEDKDYSGLYRFRPAVLGGATPKPPGQIVAGDLARGGTLEMLKIVGAPKKNTSGVTRPAGTDAPAFDVEWVAINSPDRRDGNNNEGNAAIDGADKGVFEQGWDQGGASFRRGEGIWYSAGHVYFTATTGGAAGQGQVWDLDVAAARLSMIFDSPGTSVLAGPDNLIATPAGGLLLCEDSYTSGHVQRLRGLTPGGALVAVAESNYVLGSADVTRLGRNIAAGDYRRSEFAGASFAPVGDWLFVSIYDPGVSFAITGDWGSLGL